MTKPIIDILPAYDETTQYVVKTGFTETWKEIIINYDVRDINEGKCSSAEKIDLMYKYIEFDIFDPSKTDVDMDDYREFYTEWIPGNFYKTDTLITYNGKYYKTYIDIEAEEAHKYQKGVDNFVLNANAYQPRIASDDTRKFLNFNNTSEAIITRYVDFIYHQELMYIQNIKSLKSGDAIKCRYSDTEWCLCKVLSNVTWDSDWMRYDDLPTDNFEYIKTL